MRRLSLWMRANPMVGDAALVILLVYLDMNAWDPKQISPANYFSVGALLIVPLIIRRRHPEVAAGLILFGGLLRIFTHPSDLLFRHGEWAILIMLYTLAVYTNRRTTALYATGILIESTILSYRLLAKYELNESSLTAVFWWFTPVAIAWLLGEVVAARRAYANEVEQRLAMLELERDQQAKIAVANERARIARELHDVVAHSVSVMVVQADGAAYALKDHPELAERALKTISQTGRQALGELRRLLGVLRSSEESGVEMAPQPGTSQLTELVEKVRAVGLPVELELEGDLDELPTGVGLGIYRIVQEALTNTLKHAGTGAKASVQVSRDGEQIQLRITDNGRGVPGNLVSGGNGLIGMHERANVYGGELEVGPMADGGWQVRAVLPLSNRSGERFVMP